MAIWIHVACRSEHVVTYGELEEVMGHMGWLDQPARFDPLPDASNTNDPNWGSFRVYYRPDKRPIVVHRQITSEEMEPAVADIRERLETLDDSAVKRDIEARLAATKQMFVFEIPDDLPEDVWEMCDQAEAFLARERDGIIIADEGVFDGEMNQLARFGE